MEYNELILDMLNRIVKLEKEVEILKGMGKTDELDEFVLPDDLLDEGPVIYKSVANPVPYNVAPSQRDKTRYLFNGNVYLKNRLVLAVVKEYVLKNSSIKCKELKSVFDQSLQGSIGVVEDEFTAKQRKDYQVRFFSKDDEIIHLIDGNMLVCSQWGILNIPNFIKRAEQLGYKIEQILN